VDFEEKRYIVFHRPANHLIDAEGETVHG